MSLRTENTCLRHYIVTLEDRIGTLERALIEFEPEHVALKRRLLQVSNPIAVTLINETYYLKEDT